MSPSTTTRLTLVSHAIRGEECQTSTRDPGEWPGDRVHRRCRCSKLQLVSVAPRYDGSVTAAAFDVGRHGRSTRPHRPSRLLLSDFRVIFYIYTELGSGRAARATHGFHMNLFRLSGSHPEHQAGSAPPQPKAGVEHPTFFAVTCPHTLGAPPSAMARSAEPVRARGRRKGSDALYGNLRAREGVNGKPQPFG